MMITIDIGGLGAAVMRGEGLGAGLMSRTMRDLTAQKADLIDSAVAEADHIVADLIGGIGHNPGLTVGLTPSHNQEKKGERDDLDLGHILDLKQMGNLKPVLE